jgi:hypothetical protein
MFVKPVDFRAKRVLAFRKELQTLRDEWGSRHNFAAK